ncbi:MAG: hypothetical protein VBE63_02495 [Lamprobacter sp.]|uniref:hypothetical protein n=1 Tax=Lamprobacter sp. TaxID=3100796 RepID=UPI002B259E03|nr:hypothetical protein [Lamprobacter sp.]MEA3638794.1 hypothetical protein [Lamprobacter sp.]
MRDTTMVTCRGWGDLADSDQFYPSDLPEDWRLSYFANDFRATVLPAMLWTRADPREVAQWSEDVPPSFRFAVERRSMQPSPNAAPGLEPEAQLQALGARLDGWLEPIAQASQTTTTPDAAQYLRYQYQHSTPQATSPTDQYAVLAPAELHRDLRRARDWLSAMTERQGRAPRLVILARPSSNALMAWQELLDLLGLS